MTYMMGDIYTDREGRKYKCVVAGTPPQKRPFNKDNLVGGIVMWGTVGFEILSCGMGTSYDQVTRLGVSANTDIDIHINDTLDFSRPPIEVLKYSAGEQDQTSTLSSFNSNEASDYENNSLVSFDGELALKVSYNLDISVPTPLGDGYISESNEIVAGNYYSIIGVDIQ